MEEEFYNKPLFQQLAGLDCERSRFPDESIDPVVSPPPRDAPLSQQILATVTATLQAKGLLLKNGIVVDATLFEAPSSTMNSSSERDPEINQTKKGDHWNFDMKANIGVDADSSLVCTMVSAVSNLNDVIQTA